MIVSINFVFLINWILKNILPKEKKTVKVQNILHLLGIIFSFLTQQQRQMFMRYNKKKIRADPTSRAPTKVGIVAPPNKLPFFRNM